MLASICFLFWVWVLYMPEEEPNTLLVLVNLVSFYKTWKLNMFQCNQQTWVLAVNNIKMCSIQTSSFQSMRPLFKSLKVYRAGEGGRRMKANFGAKINFSWISSDASCDLTWYIFLFFKQFLTPQWPTIVRWLQMSLMELNYNYFPVTGWSYKH